MQALAMGVLAADGMRLCFIACYPNLGHCHLLPLPEPVKKGECDCGLSLLHGGRLSEGFARRLERSRQILRPGPASCLGAAMML